MAGKVYFDICAVIALTTLIIALIVRRLVKGRTNMLLLSLLSCIIITGILDIWDELFGPVFSLRAETCYLRYALDYLYFALRNFTPILYILYVGSFIGIWHKIRGKSILRFLVELPYGIILITLLSNFFVKWVFYMDDNYVYHRGPGLIVLYAVGFYYIILGISILIKYKYLLQRRVFWIMLMFLPANAIAVFCEYLYPEFRIEIFTTAVMALVLAVAVQKPEEMVDYVSMALGYNTFVDEMNKCFNSHGPVTVMLFRFSNYRSIRESIGLESYTKLLQKITAKMTQIGRIINLHPDIYYLDQGTFAIVSPASKYDIVLDMARFIHSYMQEPMKIKQMEVMLDTKVCMVHCPYDIDSVEALISFGYTFDTKIPDQNRVIELSKISESKEFKIKNDMDAIINRGISKHNFKMYYQPIYSVKEKKFVSAEALIRLFDDAYGFVSPGLFIPAAEESGAIHQIGDFVVDEVCRFISTLDFKALGLDYIELNLSVAQCIEANLAEKIEATMAKYKIDPKQINLEITETGVDYDPVVTERNIHRLRDSGISFSLDDYGVGYSNIKRVVSLPLDIVKLDKCLVDEMDNPMMWTVIQSTVKMLKRMNKHVLVEGIEEERAFKRFAELGCDYIQGYYFSRPLPEEDYLKFVKVKNCGWE